jgi:hypothetical protein
MSALDILPDVHVELTGSELPTHIVCHHCYPQPYEGDLYALCGAPLWGIDKAPEDLDCDVCITMEYDPCPGCGI